MADEILVDANVLVYAYERAELRKQERVLETLRGLAVGRRGRLSAHYITPAVFHRIGVLAGITGAITSSRVIAPSGGHFPPRGTGGMS